jgi:hypothetical protein
LDSTTRCQRLGGFRIGELTSESATPYFTALSKALSIDSFISGVYSFSNSSSSQSDERRGPAYATLSAGWDGELQRDEQWRLQRIVILENNYAFQHQRPLHLSISREWTGWRSRLTQYRELIRFGGPIVIEKALKVDRFPNLVLPK